MSENFVFADAHDVPMPLDYFIWVIRNESRTFVVDTGFGEVASLKRGAPLLRSTTEALALMGIEARRRHGISPVRHRPCVPW